MDLPRALFVLGLALALVGVGCAHRDWRSALREDSVGAYHRFLRQHSGSGYAREARARLAFVQLRNHPTRDGFHEFTEQFPDSDLIDELRPHVEAAFFEQARALGTSEAYAAFLEDFGQGAFAARARGNADYLAHQGFRADPGALADFAGRHPESDFAAEAERSIASLRLRGQTGFRRVFLVIDVDPATPSADRLRRAFSERAAAACLEAGLELVPVATRSDAVRLGNGALLLVEHREQASRSSFERGTVTASSVVAETRVTLEEPGQKLPVWQDSFSYRAPISARSAEASILFGPGATSYWLQFFVPVATWQTQATARDARALQRPAVAVDAMDGRAAVLYDDGSFQVFDLADPSSPAVVADYLRPRDLSRFDGVAILRNRIAVFGADGLEIARLGIEGPAREHVWGRDQVGSLVGVLEAGAGLALAGTRGLLWIGDDAATPRVLVSRPILGIAPAGDHLLFTDGSALYSATLAQLSAGRVASDLRLPRGFAPTRVRAEGPSAVVLGARGLLTLDVSDPASPALQSRIEMNEVGEIRDAAFLSGRFFLLGSRGLQVADASNERVVESVDVAPRQGLDAGGRHLVLIGDHSLQVVDATPFITSAPVASLDAPE
jgi:hypothetical protein